MSFIGLASALKKSDSTSKTQDAAFKPKTGVRGRNRQTASNSQFDASSTAGSSLDTSLNSTQAYGPNSSVNASIASDGQNDITLSHDQNATPAPTQPHLNNDITTNDKTTDKSSKTSKKTKKTTPTKKKTSSRKKTKAPSPRVESEDLPASEHPPENEVNADTIQPPEQPQPANRPLRRTLLDIIRDVKSGKPTRAAANKAERKKRNKERATRRKRGEAEVSDDENETTEEVPTTRTRNQDELGDIEIEEPSAKRTRVEDDFGEFNDDNFDITDLPEDLPSDLPNEDLDDNFNQNYANPYAPQLRIGANGELEIDEDNAIITNARNEADYNDFERVTEISGPNRNINQYTHSNKAKLVRSGLSTSARWTDEETELFYKGLRQFGAEFSMISRLFPRRTRRDIRNKFKREEAENAEEIDAALYSNRTRLEIDVEAFKRSSELKDRIEGVVRTRRDPNEPIDQQGEGAIGDGVVVALRTAGDSDEATTRQAFQFTTEGTVEEDVDDFEKVGTEVVDLGDYDNYNTEMQSYERDFMRTHEFNEEEAVLAEDDAMNDYQEYE